MSRNLFWLSDEQWARIALQRGVGAITVLSITMASRFERAFTGVARSATLF